MKKKGFTLIELLAVIVILAIIALIATPAVLNIIEDSRRSAAEASTRNIANAAKTYYATKLIGNSSIKQIDITDGTLKYSGEQATKGKVFFDNEGNTYLKLYINGYCVERNYNGVVSSGKVEESECEIPEVAPESDIEKKIGDVVYYNPTLNDYCTDYVETNSDFENTSGCLRWHILEIKEDGYKLLLDHTLLLDNETFENEEVSVLSNMVKIDIENKTEWKTDAFVPEFIDMIKFTGYYEMIDNYDNLINDYYDYLLERTRDMNNDNDGFYFGGGYGHFYLTTDSSSKENALYAINFLKNNYPELILPEFLYEGLLDNCDENLECLGEGFVLNLDFTNMEEMPCAINYFGVVNSVFSINDPNTMPYKPAIEVSK